MGIYNLEKIFKPSSIAIVGASEKEGTVGWSLMNNIIKGGYKGNIFPINPKNPTIQGYKAYTSVAAIENSVDLVIISVHINNAPAIIDDCKKVNAGGVIVISAGGKESGENGKLIEAQIKQKAENAGIRVIGPNCAGIISMEASLNAIFGNAMPLPGKIAFISQSGAFCTAILDFSLKQGVGFSHFVSIGSMLDVNFGDLIDYFGNDPNVKSIVLYIENLTKIRQFMSAARAVSMVKPIVVLKSGKSKAGARAASSHTGAMTGEDAVYDAAFKRAGIVRVNTIGELFDCAELVAKQPLPKSSRIAIITNGGGPGVMAADAIASYGIEPVELSRETIEKLNAVLPTFWSKANPIDMLGDSLPERWIATLDICLKAPEINALILIFVPQGLVGASDVASTIVNYLKDKNTKPVFAVWMGGANVEDARQIYNKAGIPTYETPERAIAAFMHLHNYARNIETLQQIPQRLSKVQTYNQKDASELISNAIKNKVTLLTELESKQLLSYYRIPVVQTELATTEEQAVTLANTMGYPVVMKVHSRDIVHKSDAGGVCLDLRNETSVREAFSSIMTKTKQFAPDGKILGVTVQSMIKHPGYELILGSKKDQDFGPVMIFGMGGVMTEILKDTSIALPPLNRLLARKLMENTKVYKLLQGYRNHAPVNMELLEETLIGLSQMVTDIPEISELDINPLLVLHNQAVALDARVILKATDVVSPHHLVIGPYPEEYEKDEVTIGGIEIFMRPIKPEDAPLFDELFHTLSPRSIYFRFFSPIKSLSQKMLARFTQIDYSREIALVAMDRRQKEERMLGAARFIGDPDGKIGEFSVLVGDPWQGEGIGAALMQHLIDIAKERGFVNMSGIVLAENIHMLALARKLGFKISLVQGLGEYEVSINFNNI